MTWLNWSLKLHSRLRTIPHLIHTQNTQDLCSMNAYFICVIVHVQMWCVYSIACRSNPKRFLSILYVFENVFMLSYFKFLFMIFHVFHQKLLQMHFFEKLATKLFPQKWVKAKHKIQIETFTTVTQLFCEKSLPAKRFVLQRHFSRATSREDNLQKTHVFSFIGQTW